MPTWNIMFGLGCIGMGVQAFLVMILIAKKMWKKFPIFTAYSVFSLLQTVGTFALVLLRQKLAVSYTHWVCEFVGMFLGLAVVYEVFQDLFVAHASLRRMASTVFQWIALALIIMGFVVVYTHSAVEGSRVAAVSYVMEEGIRVIEVGLLVALFAFSGVLGLHWRQQAFGIALGLAIFTTVELAGITLRAQLGIAAAQILNLARGFSFDLSLLVWLGYVLVPARLTNQSVVQHKGQLDQWNQAVKELVYQ